MLSDQVSFPALVLRLTLLSLTPKSCLMESIKSVHPCLLIVQSCHLEVGQRITPKLTKELRPETLEEISTEVIGSLGGIFGLGFLLVLIAYKSFLMSSKEQQQQM